MRSAGFWVAGRGLAWGCIAFTLSVTQGCHPEDRHKALPELEHAAESGSEAHGESLAESHEASSVPNVIVSGVLRTIPSTPAVGFVGPEDGSFRVALRTPEIGHYPCTACHTRPIGSKSVTLDQMHDDRVDMQSAAGVDCHACHDPESPDSLVLDCAECHERAGLQDLMPSTTVHLTVHLSHPSGRLRNCLTCHDPENPGNLSLMDGTTASLDGAYRLCAGCHFTEGEDWARGAHGKRLAGWQGERVVLSCTGCHNPHSPRFPVRRPVTFPKIARRETSR